ncbi:Extracellular metalloprotease PODANS_2_14170; Flags: Precursor [Serendipita indica DSM 11827]|nr:Extracellular metalloprotease PODANS_2_14170; Flags: Precursor [Serendipita indica DSM 11827]
MRFASALLFIASAASALAAPFANATRATTRGCANTVTPAQAAAIEAQFANDFANAGLVDSDFAGSTQRAGNIQVYWHVIYKTTSVSGGYISDSAIASSISAMNSHYSGSGFSFTLAGTTRTLNANWFNYANYGNSYQTAMKKALHTGGANVLNVYTVGFTDGTLGYATFPWSYSGNPVDDGVVILYSTYPGGSTSGYNQGKTLTHEVGHWLGLYHVFQGGCSGSGDYVSDTPPQSKATSGCPSSQDSCSGGGVDSIHNYMDYSTDPCMNQFTAGQITRATSQSATYRGI